MNIVPQQDESMKTYILLVEEMLGRNYQAYSLGADQSEETTEEQEEENIEHPSVNEMRDVVFKLKSFMESSGGDYALGVEHGMQRAAEMIENIIRRYSKDSDIG